MELYIYRDHDKLYIKKTADTSVPLKNTTKPEACTLSSPAEMETKLRGKSAAERTHSHSHKPQRSQAREIHS